jgi:hypothetical protein
LTACSDHRYSPSGFHHFKSIPLWMRKLGYRISFAPNSPKRTERRRTESKKLGKQFKWKLLFGDHHQVMLQRFLSVAL